MFWSFPCVLALLQGADAKAAPAENYPRANLLIEPREIAKPEVAAKFHILDTRPLNQFKAGRIPNSSHVDAADWNKNFNAHRDPSTWGKILGNLGIDVNTPVVVTGDDLRETARVWWILKYWGVKDVRILNGGWTGWKAAGGTVAEGSIAPFYQPKEAVRLTPAKDRLMTREGLLKDLKTGHFQIADARSEGEYCGTVKHARRGGSIPGARHLEWSDLIDKQTKRFKSPQELFKLFKEAGIDVKHPTVTYCQSGGRAAVLDFALELMGGRDVRNYYRSWSEWGNAPDTPIEKPKK